MEICPMLPLEGLRVIDLSQIYQGPYATFLMAMAGAEVIKVEPPGGEKLRGLGGGDTPLSFAMLNSNKKSVTLDLKHPEGKGLLKRLVREGDVLLENYAPGVLDRLGVGYEVLKAENPRLIYASGTGYGLTGPDRDQLAMDHTIQASSGMMNLTGLPDGPPLRTGGAPIDIMGGIHLYAGVMTALVSRGITGKGTLVEVAMLESMYFTFSTDFASYHRTGEMPIRSGMRSPSLTTPYSVYACADGYIAVICVTQEHWLRMLDVMGRADLAAEPRYRDAVSRHAAEAEINALVTAWTSARSRDEAFHALRDAKVPVAPVRDLEELRTDPHMHARGMLGWFDHPTLGRVVLPNSPLRYPEHARSPLRFFPALGEHNDEVYGGLLGLPDAERRSLAAAGVI
jgi:crotonobetainyl-CoA:carnitine CoA-transferase CaiB-like acyl-CoA transferase